MSSQTRSATVSKRSLSRLKKVLLCAAGVPTIRLDISQGAKERGLEALRAGRSPFLEVEREVMYTPIDDRAAAVAFPFSAEPRPESSLRERYCTGTCAMLDAEPHLHDQGCPVAPVPGLHGGMRNEPHAITLGDICIAQEHNAARLSLRNPGERDMALRIFYLPPSQPNTVPARLPVDGDPDLEQVADVATRHPEGWR